MPALILPCACTSTASGATAGAAFQTDRYGAGRRVHNTTGGKTSGKARCTVCGTVRSV